MAAEKIDERPGLAVIANCMTPYRAHAHAALAAGIPELKLYTLITHGAAEFDWTCDVSPEINALFVGRPGDWPIAQLHNAPLREWQKGRRLIDFLETHNIRAVIAGAPQYLSYLRVLLYCRRKNLPLFVNSDSNIANEKSLSPFRGFIKRIYHPWWLKRVSGAMSMSSLGDQYFQKYGVNRERIYRMPYWPDFSAYASIDPERLQRFRRKFQMRDDRKYFVYSGRLTHVKRVDLLIDAFARIAAERPYWDVLIVGDGPLREELMHRVPIGLRSRFVWTGFLDNNEPALAYHAGDVLVLPSEREPWAVVIQEAMAAGRTVVASDIVAAAREIVVDGFSGRIFASGDVDSLVEALHDVSCHENLSRYQSHARESLDDWCDKNNPVIGVRRALIDAGVLRSTPVIEPSAMGAK